MADLFLNGKPLKLSKNGSDMICFSLSLSLSFVFCFFLLPFVTVFAAAFALRVDV